MVLERGRIVRCHDLGPTADVGSIGRHERRLERPHLRGVVEPRGTQATARTSPRGRAPRGPPSGAPAPGPGRADRRRRTRARGVRPTSRVRRPRRSEPARSRITDAATSRPSRTMCTRRRSRNSRPSECAARTFRGVISIQPLAPLAAAIGSSSRWTRSRPAAHGSRSRSSPNVRAASSTTARSSTLWRPRGTPSSSSRYHVPSNLRLKVPNFVRPSSRSHSPSRPTTKHTTNPDAVEVRFRCESDGTPSSRDGRNSAPSDASCWDVVPRRANDGVPRGLHKVADERCPSRTPRGHSVTTWDRDIGLQGATLSTGWGVLAAASRC